MKMAGSIALCYPSSETVRVFGGRARLVQLARSTVGPRVLLGTSEWRSHLGKHADQTLAQLSTPRARRRLEEDRAMEVLYPRCWGLDVHKKTVVACLLTPGPSGQPT